MKPIFHEGRNSYHTYAHENSRGNHVLSKSIEVQTSAKSSEISYFNIDSKILDNKISFKQN